MNRRVLIGLLAVAGAGIALYLLFRGDPTPKAAPASGSQTADSRPTRDVPSTPDRNAPTARIGAPDRTGNPAAAETQYQLEDGTIVRDHRSGANEPYIRPSLPRREDSPVTAKVTAKVMSAVRPIVIKCMNTVPESAFGDAPLVETRAVVKIDDQGNLDVLELGPALAHIDEDAAADALDCIRNGASSVHVHVDNPPVAEATLAFAIRPTRGQ
jgi:hypothetical protein